MSEADHHITDILLPKARVTVFSRDTETLSAADSLLTDWRYSRVDVQKFEGDVETAISVFQQQESSDLVIIQTDEIDDRFTGRLGELANYCREGTSAIVIGPVNDVYLYRRLIGMGVSDYLVRPIKPEILSQVIAKSLVAKLGVSESRLIAVIGAKGGVGASTLAQLSALAAAEHLGHKTLLLDAAGGASSLSVGMGFDPTTTLSDLARAVQNNNEDALKRMFYKVGEKLSVISGGGEAILDMSITAEQYEAIIDKLMVKSPVVIIDLSGAEASVKRRVMTRANQIIVVTTPTVTSLRFARSLLKDIGDARGGDVDEVSMIVNMQGKSKSHEVPKGHIEEAMDFKLSGYIPYHPDVFIGADTEITKLAKSREGLEIIKSVVVSVLQKSLSTVDDDGDAENEKKSGLFGGLLTKLTSK